MGTGFCGTTLVLSIYSIIATLVVVVLSVVIHQGPKTKTRVGRAPQKILDKEFLHPQIFCVLNFFEHKIFLDPKFF